MLYHLATLSLGFAGTAPRAAVRGGFPAMAVAEAEPVTVNRKMDLVEPVCYRRTRSGAGRAIRL